VKPISSEARVCTSTVDRWPIGTAAVCPQYQALSNSTEITCPLIKWLLVLDK
jgi:hypothetical protein